MTRPMREITRRRLLARAVSNTETKAATAIHGLLDRRYKWVKRDLRKAGFNRKTVAKMIQPDGKLLLKAEDDQDWNEWIDAFTLALAGALTPIVVDVNDVESKYWLTRNARPAPVDPQAILDAYQARTGRQIKNIAVDTRDNTLREITQWYNTDAGLRELIDSLEQYYSKDRAEMIARTEATNITSQVALDLYQQMSIEYFNVDLGSERGEWPCDECVKQADANPHRMSDDMPPYHPACRCGTIPATVDGGEFIYGVNE